MSGSGVAGTRNAYIGVACTLIAAIGFSAKTVIVKLAYQYGVDTMTLLALRMLFALPFFVLMAWWAGPNTTPITRHDWLAMTGLGFIGYYIGSYLDFAGLQYISAGLGRLILYLYPTLVLLLSALLLKQPVRVWHLVSLALSYSGIALVFQHEVGIGEDLRQVALGAILVFGAAATTAFYLVTGSNIVQRLGPMRFTAYALIAASFFVIAHFTVTHSPEKLLVAYPVYWLALVMAVFSTVLPLWLTAEGLKRIGANQVALVACIGPLSTILLAHLFLGEPVTTIQMAGAALVLAGVMIISLKPQPLAQNTMLQNKAAPPAP